MVIMQGKKGEVGKIFIGGFTGALAFLVLILAVVLVAQILGTQQDIQASSSTSTATNESVTGTGGTVVNAGTPTIGDNIANSTAVVMNATGTLTQGSQYSFTTLGVYAPVGTTGSRVNITYDYTVFTENLAYNVSGAGMTGTKNIGDLLATMGIIFGIALILSLLTILVVMFGRQMTS